MDDVDIFSNEDDMVIRDTEWSRMSETFTNAGYREGITAGKESALQEGFDQGFKDVGVPLGKHIGRLRGLSNALLAFIQQQQQRSKSGTEGPIPITMLRPSALGTALNPDTLTTLQSITQSLSRIHFIELVPRDLEAERHAREHLDNTSSELDKLEDAMTGMGVVDLDARRQQASREVEELGARLAGVVRELGLEIEV